MPVQISPSESANALRLRKVVKVARVRPNRDGDGVDLNRSIGDHVLPDLDPFLLLDEFRAEAPPDGRPLPGFPDHPHRGFETVTYMLAGRMRHGDNAGNKGVIGPGGVQWMTAGCGIVHSEMPEADGGVVRGFQLWINLPAAEKMRAPRYQEFASAQIPETALGDARIRIVAGKLGTVEGVIRDIATAPLYFDLTLPPAGTATIPVCTGYSAFLYGVDGITGADGLQEHGPVTIAAGMLAVLSDGDTVRIHAGTEGARLLLVAGRPLREPVARYGPFVMNTRAELLQAFEDFRAGRF